jgi:hypothetical protein
MARSTLDGYGDKKPSLVPSLELSDDGRSKPVAESKRRLEHFHYNLSPRLT